VGMKAKSCAVYGLVASWYFSPWSLNGMKQPCVYILSNKYHGTVYVGVTSNLVQRVWQHKTKCAEGFTKKYAIDRLVYYQLCDDMYQAISREKQLKAGNRARKIALIERTNPQWLDLYSNIVG